MAKKGDRTRQIIVDRSLQLFSVKGYYNTAISDILAETGLTKGGLYGHFPSKENLWNAVYDEAVRVWKGIVFKNMPGVADPLECIDRFIVNDMRHYLGGEVFAGGCFFLNMLVELSGQSERMSRRILKGFVQLSRLLQRWLEDAERRGLIRKGLDHRQIADFIVISLNGAAALYISSRDRAILETTVIQLRRYIGSLKA